MAKQTTIDKQTAIIKTARRLPIDSRQAIVDALAESIKNDEGKAKAVDRIAQLIPIAEEVFECTYDPKRKAETDTCVRNVCAKVMRMEGYSYTAIAKAMKRHRSSVYVMTQRAEEMDAGYFGLAVRDKYVEFMVKAL